MKEYIPSLETGEKAKNILVEGFHGGEKRFFWQNSKFTDPITEHVDFRGFTFCRGISIETRKKQKHFPLIQVLVNC